MKIELRLPADDPLFRDHFPGRPVLPAIGQLELLRRAFAGPGFIAELDGLRFRRQVGPGELIELELERSSDGRTRFTIRCEGEVATVGSLRWCPDA